MKSRPVDWLKLAALIVVFAAMVAAFWVWGDHIGGGPRGPRSTP